MARWQDGEIEVDRNGQEDGKSMMEEQLTWDNSQVSERLGDGTREAAGRNRREGVDVQY